MGLARTGSHTWKEITNKKITKFDNEVTSIALAMYNHLEIELNISVLVALWNIIIKDIKTTTLLYVDTSVSSF